MKNCEKARAYVKSHKEPVQKALPEFFQKWSTPYGPEYWRSSTCERSQWTPKGAIVKSPGKSIVMCAYIHYIPEYDMLEFSKVAINNKGRHKDDEIYKWEYISDRYFLVKGDVQPYDQFGNELCPEKNGRYYNLFFYKYLKELKQCYFYDQSNPQYKEIELFCEYKIDPVDFAEEYYRYMMPRKQNGVLPEPQRDKYQIILEYLNKRELKDSYLQNRLSTSLVAYFEQINSEYSVIRCFSVVGIPDDIDKIGIFEYQRIYITPKGVKTLKGHLGTWTNGKADFISLEMINIHEFSQHRDITHAYDLAVEIDPDINLETIYILLSHPLLELLYKAGYKNIANKLNGHRYNTTFEELFGVKEKSMGSIYRRTGCSKYMLKAIDQHLKMFTHPSLVLKIYKEVFGENYRYFNKETIDKYYHAFTELAKWSSARGYHWSQILPTENASSKETFRLLERFVKIFNKEDHCIFSVLSDTSRMYHQLGLNYGKAVADMLHSTEDIIELHDRTLEQLNASRRMIQHKKEQSLKESFEKLQEERISKYNYENDNYQIRVPESMDEIIDEGNSLHHCVGSYVYKHAKGVTDIVFLRQKDNPRKPFYTIEVQNKKVIQIHGLANRWLGCNPEAVSFVYDWIKKVSLSCQNDILLSNSRGYRNRGILIDERYLYEDGHRKEAAA